MKIRLISLNILLVTAVTLFLNYEKDKKIKNYLKNQTKIYKSSYDVHYHMYEQHAKILFDTLVGKKEIIDIYKKLENSNKEKKDHLRKKLFNMLNNYYEKIQYTQLKQLHFHLKSNESFLRFHKPSKFGDDLSGIRATVEYVNSRSKPIDGFEMGRVYSGIRFVFPVKSEKEEHLGSVEISFDISVFTKEYMEHFKVPADFYLDKKILEKRTWENFIDENYLTSDIKGYYFEKRAALLLREYSTKLNLDFENKISKGIIEKALAALKKKKTISLYDDSSKKILTFIPVLNPVSGVTVAFFCIKTKGEYIPNKIYNFYFILFLSSLLISSLFFIFYKEWQTKKILKIKVEKRTSELKELNNKLEIKIENAVNEIQKKDKMIYEHSKMVSMSEIVMNIAHQWRQPLNILGVLLLKHDIDYSMGKYDDKKNKEFNEKTGEIINKMSTTINSFMNLFKPDNTKEEFGLRSAILESLKLTRSISPKEDINIIDKTQEEFYIYGYKSELIQVFLNIMNNSKDAAMINKIKKPEIIIDMKGEQNNIIISFKDNMGGIPEELLTKIFEPYYTTKFKSEGTGLGLFISKMVVEETMGGKLEIVNKDNGVEVLISFSKKP